MGKRSELRMDCINTTMPGRREGSPENPGDPAAKWERTGSSSMA